MTNSQDAELIELEEFTAFLREVAIPDFETLWRDRIQERGFTTHRLFECWREHFTAFLSHEM